MKIGGLEVLKRVRAHQSTRFLPVVVLTSSMEEEDRISAYRSGCNSYVRKPVDFSRFLDIASQLQVLAGVERKRAPMVTGAHRRQSGGGRAPAP